MAPQCEGQAQRVYAHPLEQYVSRLPEYYNYAPLDTVLLAALYKASVGAGAVDPTAQYLDNTPIRLHLEQIVDSPSALFAAAAAAGPDLRTGNSIYFMTDVMPLLASPDGGWKWRSGCRRAVVKEDVLMGERADYRFIDSQGGATAFKCSMFVYTFPAVERMIVKYVRRN